MASNFTECPTGILIDFVGNTTASNSPHCNEKGHEENLIGNSHNVENCHEKKEVPGCNTLFENSCSNPSNSCLGSELNAKKNERDTWSGWRTPSPTTMNMISEEASRIVDQLDTSLETSLWDEEFPLSTLEEDCSEEFQEPVVLSQNAESKSVNSNTLTGSVNVIKQDIPIENELVAKGLSSRKRDFSPIKDNNIDTKETSFTLRYESDMKVNFNVTEKNNGANNNSGSFRTTGKNFNIESVALAEENSGANKRRSCIKEGSFELADENCSMLEEKSSTLDGSSGALEGSSRTLNRSFETLTEISRIYDRCPGADKIGPGASKRSPKTIDGSPGADEIGPGVSKRSPRTIDRIPGAVGRIPGAVGGSPEVVDCSSGTLKGSPDTLEGNLDTLEESPGTLERSPKTLEGSSISNSKNSANEKYIDTLGEISFDERTTKSICSVMEENYFIRKENSMVTEKNQIVKVAGNVKLECSSVRDSKDSPSKAAMKQGYLSANSIVNENSIKSTPSKFSIVKSKLSKVFKDPASKTPLMCSKAKENMLQTSRGKNATCEEKNCKVGPLSVKSVLGDSNINGSDILSSKPTIKTPLSKHNFGKIPFVRGENKPNMSMLQDQAKETIKQSNTPLKSKNSLQFHPTSSIKTPLFKSNSMVDTPNLAKPVRRSNSFQTRPSIENFNQVKREKSFVAVSHLKTMNCRMSLHQTTRNGSDLKTPSKNLSFLPKSNTFATPFASNAKSCAKTTQIACPSFGSALKQINTPNPNGKQVVGIKRPASTTSKSRFVSRLELPSPLPKAINDSLSRQLFPDNTPKKRFN